ncbi:MAG: metalloprotease PmbA [Gammaproteobacteria bacterium]|jgi:PmbA protein
MPNLFTKTSQDASDAFDQELYNKTVEMMLDEASKQGASSAEAGLSVESGLSVNVRLGEVETIEHNRDKVLGATVYFGQRKGSASTTDFTPEAIRETVKAACDIARYTEEDPYAGLADAELMARDIPDLGLYCHWNISAEAAIEMARECEDTARNFDKRITNSEGSAVSTHDAYRFYGNSNGFMGGYASSRHSLSCTVIGETENGMQRDHWYTIAREPAKLESAQSVGERAAQHTVNRLDARKIPTCQSPVIFSAEVARGLLASMIRAISGSSQYRKSSFLLDAKGQQVFPGRYTIDERPHLVAALGSCPFDHEGVATQHRNWVADGVLQGYVLDSYSARRLGLQTTGNAGGVHNLFINSDDKNREELLKEMGTGLLVTEVMGQGVNIVTGDYSRGASGFWVENGEIQYPVEEITIASTLQNMYQQLIYVGNDVDKRGNIQTGSWLIEKMSIAGS